MQAPAQFTNTLPADGVWTMDTVLFSANANAHVPAAAMFDSAQVSPDGVLLSVPPPSDPVAAASVSVGGAANCAVTTVLVPMTVATVQLVPEHAPVYPLNDERPSGVAVSVTTLLAGKVALQVPPEAPAVIVQLIPAGTLVTTPLPVPPPLTLTLCV